MFALLKTALLKECEKQSREDVAMCVRKCWHMAELLDVVINPRPLPEFPCLWTTDDQFFEWFCKQE